MPASIFQDWQSDMALSEEGIRAQAKERSVASSWSVALDRKIQIV